MEALAIGAQFEPKAGETRMLEPSRLTEQDFLQVMVAQLRNQNPMDPQGDTEFMSQLASFEQLASLNKLNETLSALTGLSLLGQASGLLGREIAADMGSGENPLIGLVETVELSQGEPLLLVDGMLIPISAVMAVRIPTAEADSESV